MGSSDRSDDDPGLGEFLRRIGRRKLIAGAAIGVLGWAIFSQPTSDGHLTRAEDRLVGLAASIDEADLVNPQQSWSVHDEVAKEIESVNDDFDQPSPNDSETRGRIASLNTAIEYYTELEKTLAIATSAMAQVADSEFNVLYHERSSEYDPAAKFDLAPLKESIASLSEAEKVPAAVTSQDRKLVPNQQQVVESLQAQFDVLELHITAQRTYLDTATTIEVGVRAHEQSRFDVARSKLTQARESLTDGISPTNHNYRLFPSGLTLDQYATLLALRREGVTKLLDVSKPSVPKQQRRAASNEAIDRFFEARRAVTSQTTEPV